MFGAGWAYHCARPSYPPAVLSRIVALLRAHPGRVVEAGAGTGKFTALLASYRFRVTAVEPSASMCRVLRDQALPGVEVVERGAEAVGGPAGRFAAAVAAQSLHWFADAALPELARVMAPGAPLIMLWNEVDPLEGSWLAGAKSVVEELDESQIQYRHMRWKQPFTVHSDLFSEPVADPGTHFALWRTPEQIWRFYETHSFVARLPEAERAALRERVLAGAPGMVPFRTRTDCFVAHRLGR